MPLLLKPESTQEQLTRDIQIFGATVNKLCQCWSIYGRGHPSRPSRFSACIPLGNYWYVRQAANKFVYISETFTMASESIHPAANALGGITLLQLAEVEPNSLYQRAYKDVGRVQVHLALPKYSKRFQKDLSVLGSADIRSCIELLFALLYSKTTPREVDLDPFMLSQQL